VSSTRSKHPERRGAPGKHGGLAERGDSFAIRLRSRCVAVCVVCVCMALVPGRLDAQDRGASALGAALRGLAVSTRVLIIGAHPDDEDTQVITWLSRGRNVETAYLSLTRGDGGQNIIGNELGEALGVIRTEELLAARRVDGGKQFFTRAYDYGFSKNAEEAFTQWPHDSLLRDVLTVVRSFRPHVIISVFTGTPRDGHGQHQAAGILAREAYDWSGDTARVTRAATQGYGAWTVSKFYRGASFRRDSATFTMNVGEYDPVLGRSYAEIAAISRSQHRSQAFGTLQPLGVRLDYLQRQASRVPAPVDPKAEQSIFDGMDTTWARFRGRARDASSRASLDSLPQAFADAQRSFDAYAPERSIPALGKLKRLLDRLCAGELHSPCTSTGNTPGAPGPPFGYLAGTAPDGTAENDLGRSRGVALERVDNALRLASGVVLDVIAPRELWAIDQSVTGTVTVYNRGRLPLHVTDDVTIEGMRTSHQPVVTVPPDSTFVRQFSGRPFARTGIPTAPWWLAEPRTGAMFANLRVRADEGAVLPEALVRLEVMVDSVPFTLAAPVVYRYADQVRGEIRRPIAGVPAVSVRLEQEFEYVPARVPIERELRVHVWQPDTAARAVEVTLRLPTGLTTDSSTRSVTLPPAGSARTVPFRVRGTLPAGRHVIEAVATVDGKEYAQGYATIDYEHISPRRMYRPSRLTIESVDVAGTANMRVGYIQGVGDNSAPALEQLGVTVTRLNPATLGQVDLSGYTAIVVGPRAYETQPALVANNARLLDYARAGGTLVVQYGQYEMQQPGMMPYPVTINRPHDRVTNEKAPVTILDTDAAVLRSPNRITTRDFEGWIQDRSLYMPRTFDSAYTPVLAMNDPGEQPSRGALLVAPLGRGTYVYTTLAFFRQLPNGVPGAARLFVNLLAAKANRPAQ
jgi:LmbE family N-acetylglucosaminyl deacetylase